MRFNLNNTEFKISFSFFALILFVVTSKIELSFLFIFVFVLFHESVHLLFIYIFSGAPKKVTFTLFGANILREVTFINRKAEIIINLSAPILNLLISGVFFLLSKRFVYNQYFYEFFKYNLMLGIFNLIPFYNFDGGNALRFILLGIMSERATHVTQTIISIFITIIFSFLSIYIFINHLQNYTLVLMSIYMIIVIIFKK